MPDRSREARFYTERDADCLDVILKLMGGSPHPGGLACPNRVLAEQLGLSVGAAAARLFRLEELGVIRLEYDFSPKNGRLQQRVIKIVDVPPRPWTAKETNGSGEPAPGDPSGGGD